MKSILAAAALAAAAVAAPANAATIEVVSGTQRNFALGFFGNSAGQSFTAVDTSLTTFGFQFIRYLGDGNISAPNLAYTLTLVNGAGLTGPAITSRTFTVPTTIASTAPSWIDVDITGTTVTAGQVYTAVLSSANIKFGLAMGPSINLSTGAELTSDAYAGGRAFFAQTVYPNCARTGNCDINFRVTGTTATAAVPEPATWALMLMGFGAVGSIMRRRVAATSRIRFA